MTRRCAQCAHLIKRSETDRHCEVYQIQRQPGDKQHPACTKFERRE